MTNRGIDSGDQEWMEDWEGFWDNERKMAIKDERNRRRRKPNRIYQVNIRPWLSRDSSERVNWHSLRHKVAWQVFIHRNMKAMSQKELAELLGTQTSTISRIENEKQNVTIDYLEKIAKAMGMEVEIRFREPESKR